MAVFTHLLDVWHECEVCGADATWTHITVAGPELLCEDCCDEAVSEHVGRAEDEGGLWG
jgi:hypothetical protein